MRSSVARTTPIIVTRSPSLLSYLVSGNVDRADTLRVVDIVERGFLS